MRRVITTAATLLLLVACVWWIDRPLARYCYDLIHDPNTAAINPVAQTISLLGLPHFWVSLCLLWAGWKLVRTSDHRRALLCCAPVHALASVLCSTVLVRLTKWIASRPRPAEWFEENMYGFTWSFDTALNSFPSGHVSFVSAIMSALMYHYPRLRYPGYLCILLVAIARMIQTKHYLSDCIAGYIVGAVAAAISYRYLLRCAGGGDKKRPARRPVKLK